MEPSIKLAVTVGLTGTGILGMLISLARLSYALGRQVERSYEQEKRQIIMEETIAKQDIISTQSMDTIRSSLAEFRAEVIPRLSAVSERTARIEENVGWLKKHKQNDGE